MRCLVVFLLASSMCFLSAQITEPAPAALLEAGHCLAVDQRDWLDVGREKPYDVELGYASADKSESGKEAPLYLIEFTTPTHTAGFAFIFLGKGKESHRDLQLQFRTPFHQTDDGSQKVSLVDPPLGGVGTQDDILAAIQQVGFHTWRVPVANLRNYSGGSHCDTGEAVM